MGSKVNNIIQKGLKLLRVKIAHPMKNERMKSSTSTRPGVITATCESDINKADIMKAKSDIAQVDQYIDIVINLDKSKQ